MFNQQKYQAICTDKGNFYTGTWTVVYLPTNENLSHHEGRSAALATIKRYEAADARRKG